MLNMHAPVTDGARLRAVQVEVQTVVRNASLILGVNTTLIRRNVAAMRHATHETEGRRVAADARDWTRFVLVYVHVLRVRRRVGRIGVL